MHGTIACRVSTTRGAPVNDSIEASANAAAPAILLEAVLSLDVALERSVSAAVRNLRITRILVAHRPETIRSTDRVIAMTSAAERTRAPLLQEAAALH